MWNDQEEEKKVPTWEERSELYRDFHRQLTVSEHDRSHKTVVFCQEQQVPPSGALNGNRAAASKNGSNNPAEQINFLSQYTIVTHQGTRQTQTSSSCLAERAVVSCLCTTFWWQNVEHLLIFSRHSSLHDFAHTLSTRVVRVMNTDIMRRAIWPSARARSQATQYDEEWNLGTHPCVAASYAPCSCVLLLIMSKRARAFIHNSPWHLPYYRCAV